MKRQNLIVITIIIILIAVLIVSLIYIQYNQNKSPIIGGDKDIHGCIGSAGYSWCEAKQKCIRPWEEACTPNDCKNITLDNCQSAGCVICPPCEVCSSISCNSKEFCNSIGINDSWYNSTKPPEKTYCTPEQKNSQVCPEYYSATCGWFNSSIRCIKYPCAQTFANPCFACANSNVEYYTEGECPK